MSFNIGNAVHSLRAGERVRRKAFQPGVFLFLVPGEVNVVAPDSGMSRGAAVGTEVRQRATIYRTFLDGSVGAYTFDQNDVLAGDWVIEGEPVSELGKRLAAEDATQEA